MRCARESLPFAVHPAGIDGGQDFSFIVIGDTGEGDASQHILRDQLLAVSNQPDVRFVVISSDVVYPVGAMRDYEAKFWLPFKGVTKPTYAIPGNHDWYDALEAFAATFLEPAAARASMRARVETDLRLTSTTEDRIEGLIRQAAWLREQYDVPTGFQRAPFFEIQTDNFALICVDTGVVKRVDAEQWSWLQSALERARGKLVMAVLGHPFFAGGSPQTDGYEDFVELRRLLREHDVAIIMAGDTHDLEYYVEPQPKSAAVHHFVNGGGGAYLSFGTSLAWPTRPADVRLGVLPGYQSRDGENRSRHALVEASGVVVDPAAGRLAILGRMAVGGLRLQRRPILSELREGARRAVVRQDPPATLRHPRPADVGRSGFIREHSASGHDRGDAGRVAGADEALTGSLSIASDGGGRRR